MGQLNLDIKLVLVMFIFVSFLAISASPLQCENDSDCKPFLGNDYICINASSNTSYCEPVELCTSDSDCIGNEKPCCDDSNLCAGEPLCNVDSDCPLINGREHKCINGGTCDAYCVPVLGCEDSVDCTGFSKPCCSSRGACEEDYICTYNSDCSQWQDASFECVNPGSCDSYCELAEGYIDKANERCKMVEFEYPTMSVCLSGCYGNGCFLNTTSKCFECIDKNDVIPVGNCSESGLFDTNEICKRHCEGLCFLNSHNICWECIDSITPVRKKSCESYGDVSSAASCNEKCGTGLCYMRPSSGCFFCRQIRDPIQIRQENKQYDIKMLEGISLPFPLSFLHGNDRILVTENERGTRFMLIIENGAIKRVETAGLQNPDIIMFIRNTRVINDFVKSVNPVKYYKDARSSNYITIQPANGWAYVKVAFTNIFLLFV